MLVTEEGQISIDFLLGISIFLLTLGFLIQFIPGLFLSISEDGSLNSVAYRTANILTEDPGWWANPTGNQNGTDWEENLEYLSRIGLAYDKTPRTKQTKTPNILNRGKIKEFQNLSTNESLLTIKLGLYDKINGAQVDYGYNITFFNQTNIIMSLNGSPLSFGKTRPTYQDVFKITRQVLVETGKMASFQADELTKNSSDGTVEINISSQTEDVVIQITDFNTTPPNTTFDNLALNGSLLNKSDYSVYKKTNTSIFDIYSDPLNSTDTLRFIFNSSYFNNTDNQLKIKFNNTNFSKIGPPFVKYNDQVEPFYEPASLVVMVWK